MCTRWHGADCHQRRRRIGFQNCNSIIIYQVLQRHATWPRFDTPRNSQTTECVNFFFVLGWCSAVAIVIAAEETKLIQKFSRSLCTIQQKYSILLDNSCKGACEWCGCDRRLITYFTSNLLITLPLLNQVDCYALTWKWNACIAHSYVNLILILMQVVKLLWIFLLPHSFYISAAPFCTNY